MGSHVRSNDWESTPLGAIATWPAELKTIVELLLSHQFPMVLLWGPDLVQIYNDGYREIMGAKHPSGFGRPTREVWPEVWDFNAPIYARVLNGETVTLTDQRFSLVRGGTPEEVWITLCYSPVRDVSGTVAGVFLTLFDTTARLKEEAERESREQRYEALFNAIDEGVNLGEVIFDNEGRAVDILYVAENPAAMRMVGRSIAGRRLSEFDPEHELYWTEIFGRVVRTGEPERLQRYAKALDIWFDFYLFKPPGVGEREFMMVFRDITEQKRAEEMLSASEARFRNALEIETAGAIFFNVEGTITDVNDAFLRMSGYSRDDVSAGNVRWDVMTPAEFMPASLEAMRNLESTGWTRPFEKQYVRKDGARWWALCALRKLGDRTGFELALDISDRKDAEERLRASEAQLAAVLDLVPVGVGLFDKEGRYVLRNRELLSHIPGGVIPSRDPGRQWRSYTESGRALEPEDFPGARALRGEAVTGVDFTAKIDGKELWFRVGAVPLLKDGAVAGAVAITHDVTDSKIAERGLRESRRRLRSLIVGIPQLLWRATDTGEWRWSSPQWISYTGFSEAESIGRGWLRAVHPQDRKRTGTAWTRARLSKAFDVEHRLREAPSGTYRWFRTRASPVYDEDGGLTEWLGTSTDVDELRQLQERQKLLLAELQHRVRNTLAVVRSITRRTARTSRTVEDYAMNMEGRIDAFARAQALVTLDPASGVDLEGLVAEELLAHAAHEGEQVRIKGPAVRLQAKAAEMIGLAIHELATNAVKFGALSAPRGRIAVKWQIIPAVSNQIGRPASRRLSFEWSETGASIDIGEPRRRGFGTELIERTLRYELDATASLSFSPIGLRCMIELPLTDQVAVPPSEIGLIAGTAHHDELDPSPDRF